MGMESLILINHDYLVPGIAACHKLGSDVHAACIATEARFKEFRGGKVIYTDDAQSLRIVAVGDHLFEVLAVEYGGRCCVADADTQMDLLRAAAAKLGYKLVRLTPAKKKETKPPDRSKEDATTRTPPSTARRRKQPR